MKRDGCSTVNLRLSFVHCSDDTGLATPTVARDMRRTKAAEGICLKCISRYRTFLVSSNKDIFDISKSCN